MQKQRRTPEQIAAAMTGRFGDRPRAAWRHAYGWTQKEVAARYNREINDKQSSMNANRISDYERWPRKGGRKPTVRALAVLAKIYSTRALNLIDSYDRQKLDTGELINLSAAEFAVVPRQLPSTIPNFVGRAHELDILTSQLDVTTAGGGAVVITSIGGTAGIGKTTLAVHWARQYCDHFPHGQLYVDLRGFDPSGTPVNPATVIRGFLDAFQVPADKVPIDHDNQAALYRSLVEDRRLVIVLDNARDADQVWPLLPGSPTCLVLVTSRQQLGSLIARKRAIYITLDFMTDVEARRLLTEFLGPERIHAESDVVEELIQRCVGLPIALSITAARILNSPHLPLSTLVGELREERQRLGALSTGDSQLTDIRAVFSWSYTALSPQAARLFRLLGLHPGPDINLYAAASLAGLPISDTYEFLAELTRAYLLDQHTPGRYQCHDLLRVYAIEQAVHEEPEPLRRAALHRVLDYYLHTSFAAIQHIVPHRNFITLQVSQPGTVAGQITDHKQAWQWFTAEHAVLLDAIDHAATDGFDIHAWQLPWTLSAFLNRRGHWNDYAATQQTAVAAADRLSDRAAQALALGLLGHAHARLGRSADALDSLQQALTLQEELSDRDGQAHTRLSIAWLYERQSQYTEALIHAQHALDLSRVTGHPMGQANALNALGWYHARLGYYQQALTHCQQALNLYRELGDCMGVASTLDSLGDAYYHLGQTTQAITHYQQAIALFRDVGDHFNEANTLTRFGGIQHATGNFVAARDTWQQALAIFDRLGLPDAEHIRTKLDNLDTGSNKLTTDD